MNCWVIISKIIMKPMGRPVASSNRKVVDSVRRLLAVGVNDGMRFQKLGGWEGEFAALLKAYEDWDWVGGFFRFFTQRTPANVSEKEKKNLPVLSPHSFMQICTL